MYIYISYFFVLVHILSSILVCVLYTYIHTCVHSWYLSRIRTAIACNELHLLDSPWSVGKTKNFENVSKMILFSDDNNAFLFLTSSSSSRPCYYVLLCVFLFLHSLGSLDPRKRFCYTKSNVNLSSITKRALCLEFQERSTKLHENSLIRSPLVALEPYVP